MNLETSLQNEISVALSELGSIPYRMQVGLFYTRNAVPIHIGIPGTPDLLIIIPDGKVLWYEIKTEIGRLSKDQSNFADMLRSMNHKVFIIRSVSDAVNIYKQEVPNYATI